MFSVVAIAQIHWIGRNVLSVRDFTWLPGSMELEHPVEDEEVLDPLRGEVRVWRVKRMYHERTYNYEFAVTPENVVIARRGGTWIANYFWRRALYAVQYDGMSESAILSAIRARSEGFAGGMPVGHVISAEEAVRRWVAGERAYMRLADPLGRVGQANAYDLSNEPMFVELNAEGRFTVGEMHTATAGAVYRELGEEMGTRPYSGGINSGRRNSAVALSRGLDEAGMGQMAVKKLMHHRGSTGTGTFEAQYDDSIHSTSIGSLMMGKTPERIESLRSLMMTCVPELVQYRVWSDIPKDDPVRVELYDGDATRVSLLEAQQVRAKVLQSIEGKLAEVGLSEGASSALKQKHTEVSAAMQVRQ